ncbi:MAG: SLBB domain-containing protein [Treponema sp.]|nr:SLBB domain-containing protein [Treponema sp.]
MKVYSFPRGGLSFEDPSVPSKGPSIAAFLPALSVIPLVQYPGERAYPLVTVGDHVREGMLVGRGGSSGSVNVYATVPGRVLRTVTWKDGEGRDIEALVIRMEGSFERLGKREEHSSWSKMNSHDLQRLITEFGIVEMEGSGHPLAETIASFKNSVTLSLVVRCVFDDPWLAADYALCRERLAAVVEGTFIAAKARGMVRRVVFAVSHREKDMGEAMLAEAAKWDIPASLVLVGSKYPQRNRRELELALRNYEKSEGIELGSLLILGPATLAAVYDAVVFKRPVLDRYVAVGGSAVKNPQVMKVRIGKRIGDLIEECGGFIGKPRRIATGSPLLGKTVVDLDEPVTKTSYAVFAMLKDQVGDYARRDCISCGECRSVCPVGIDPEELYKQIIRTASRMPEDAAECHGCGCCEVVCPSRLPLTDTILGRSREEQRA